MDKTKIAWTDATWNPLRGCSRVSAGCEHCYAEAVAGRFSGPGLPYEGLTRKTAKGARWTGEIKTVEHVLDQPLRWQKPRRIFVNSMSDLFHEGVSDQYITQVFDVMAAAPRHTFQILTKRADRMREFMSERLGFWSGEILPGDSALSMAHEFEGMPLPNVHLGVSVENHHQDHRIADLLATPAAVRFVSAEPLLSGLDLSCGLRIGWQCSGCAGFFTGPLKKTCPTCKRKGYWCGSHKFNPPGRQIGSGIDWVIVGGESGPGARPCDVQWIGSIVEQCREASVRVFVKQLGAKPCNLSAGVWRTRPDGNQDLYFGEHSAATIWPNGTWSTWDKNGVGGENDAGPLISARRHVEAALVRQMWHGIKLEHPKGADPDEWPEDLRVRQFPGDPERGAGGEG